MPADIEFQGGQYQSHRPGDALQFSFGAVPANLVLAPSFGAPAFSLPRTALKLVPPGIAAPSFGSPPYASKGPVNLAFGSAEYVPPSGVAIGFVFSSAQGLISAFGIPAEPFGAPAIGLRVAAQSAPPSLEFGNGTLSRGADALVFGPDAANPVSGILFKFGAQPPHAIIAPMGSRGALGEQVEIAMLLSAVGIPSRSQPSRPYISKSAADLQFSGDQPGEQAGGILFQYSGYSARILPYGGSFAAAGMPSIRNAAAAVAQGWSSQLFGDHFATLKARLVKPAGFLAGSHGTPEAKNLRAYVRYAGAVFAQGMGTPLARLRNSHLRGAGFESERFSTPRVEYRIRSVNHSGYQSGLSAGTPWVSRYIRYIEPAGFYLTTSANHLVGGTRFVAPVGYVATLFGSRIIPESRTIYPSGASGSIGAHAVENRRSIIPTKSIRLYTEDRHYFGQARVFNLLQAVVQTFDGDSGLAPPPWPLWTKIENRNRTVSAFGWPASSITPPKIDNNARIVAPGGVSPALQPGQGWAEMVSHRVRYLPVEPIEHPYISSWGVVRNAARVLAASGSDLSLFGIARAENRSREFRGIGALRADAYGTPFVAPRIREVSFESRYGISPPIIPVVSIKLHTRYIQGAGAFESAKVGWVSAEIHWNRITPRWTLQNFYGYPAVRNLTPELLTRGRNSEEFGVALAWLQWRPVLPAGRDTSLFGLARIADKKQRVTAGGVLSLRLGDKLTVRKMGIPPLAKQFIFLASDDQINNPEGGNGIRPPGYPQSQVGTPHMQQQFLYVKQDMESTTWGIPRITANSIRVEPGYWDLLIGEPIVGLRVRTVAVKEFDPDYVYEPPKARVTPHTIWATTEAPAQARLNHPTALHLHPVDGFNRAPGAILGTPRAMLKHRAVRASGAWSQAFGGSTRVANKRHYIACTSIYSFRMGWHSIPGPQEAEVFDAPGSGAFGTAAVKRPPYRGPLYVTASGFSAARYGGNWVSHFHRTVLATGWNSLAAGTKIQNDTPYAWRGLRVGPLMPTIPSGFSADKWGVAWASHRVRGIEPAGFDTFFSEYQLEAFDKRMRVDRRAASGPAARPPRYLTPVGILAFSSSASDIKPGTHYIRPDGNADQFRKGAF